MIKAIKVLLCCYFCFNIYVFLSKGAWVVLTNLDLITDEIATMNFPYVLKFVFSILFFIFIVLSFFVEKLDFNKFIYISIFVFFSVSELPIFYGKDYLKNNLWLAGKEDYSIDKYDPFEK